MTDLDNRRFIPNQEFVNQINNAQSSWKAVVYDEYTGMTVAQLISRAGGSKRLNFPKPRWVTTLSGLFWSSMKFFYFVLQFLSIFFLLLLHHPAFRFIHPLLRKCLLKSWRGAGGGGGGGEGGGKIFCISSPSPCMLCLLIWFRSLPRYSLLNYFSRCPKINEFCESIQ